MPALNDSNRQSHPQSLSTSFTITPASPYSSYILISFHFLRSTALHGADRTFLNILTEIMQFVLRPVSP